jgi:ATP-binding cassette subfamily B protein/ATP-binding cassette subfamily C protein LapB
MDSQTSNHLSPDPLWSALERIFSFYHLILNKDLVGSQISIDWDASLKPADILLIARHLGLDVSVHAMAGIDIKNIQKPALVIIENLKSLVVLPQDDPIPALWVPNNDVDIDLLNASTKKNLYVFEFDKPHASLNREEEGKGNAQWFWSLLSKHARDYIDVGIATFFINLFVLITPLFSMTVFDRVVPNHAHETLIALTIGIVFAFIFNFGFKIIRGRILGLIVARLSSKLDGDLMNHLLRLKTNAHKLTVGERFDLFNELQGLRDFFASRLLPALVDLPFFVLFLLVIYIIGSSVALVVLVGVILLLSVNILCRATLRRSAAIHFREMRGKNAILVEMLTGVSTIRMFNAIGKNLFHWERLATRGAESARHNQEATGIADDLSLTIMSLTSIFVIVVGVNAIEKGDMTVGGLIACNILVSRTLSPIMGLTAVVGRIRQSLDSLKTIDNIFCLPAEPQLTADYALKGPFSGAMRLQDVTYYHQGQVNPTLYRLNLDIKPGEKVGLIGRTGAGKSTITRILDGSLTPQTGQIFIDNLVLNSIHPAEWRKDLGIVPQEPFIFSGTMRQNILLGIQDVVDENWMKQVVAMSGLDLVMQQAGYGLDFEVGEGGVRLSGGQRQSLAIARALIRKPKILLLDEPTNGMDNDLELRVKNALQEYAKDKTMVLVTHRTTLLNIVNRLVLIDQGSVAMDGASDEVIRKLSNRVTGGTHV